MAAPSTIERLLAIMARLRDPERGCPWDIEQDFASIAPYTIEEAFEVADAIQRGALGDLRDELGDLLLQVVFHAQMASEQQAFDFNDVVASICDKMVRRHPHVFGDAVVKDAAAQTVAWEELKRAERDQADPSVLADIPHGLPEWIRARKLQKRAASVGFDWPDAAEVLAKLDEELAELRQEIDTDAPRARLQDEFGDVLFVMCNLARKLDIDPGAALRGANAKFERRFRHMEAMATSDGQALQGMSLEQQDGLWSKARQADHRGEL
ncbi:MAG: nucleoside triphosphate pyrophosphohydrolase [Rhodanobacteraceae bacterium]|nr:nucleoside triphosphate pyrophosphohydrolase [Rhodanobacteraceae bacterium]